jgi:serine/threonine protein kinase
MVIIFNYNITNLLGKGSYSLVYSANDIENKDNEYAIKVIKINKVNDQIRNKIKLEVDILSKLNNPNIIKLYNNFYHDGLLYIVFEKCKSDLDTYIKENYTTIDKEQKIEWIHQLISGLLFLHDNKIIHRDIKPKNILISFDNQVKISDFGFARYIDSTDLLNTICGTPLFMSPELFSNDSIYDYKSDYWSMGIIFYFILIGTIPLNAKNIPELIIKIKNITDIKIPSCFSDKYDTECINLIELMLITSLKHRISYKDLLNHNYVKRYKLNNNIKSNENIRSNQNIKFNKSLQSSDMIALINSSFDLEDFDNNKQIKTFSPLLSESESNDFCFNLDEDLYQIDIDDINLNNPNIDNINTDNIEVKLIDSSNTDNTNSLMVQTNIDKIKINKKNNYAINKEFNYYDEYLSDIKVDNNIFDDHKSFSAPYYDHNTSFFNR